VKTLAEAKSLLKEKKEQLEKSEKKLSKMINDFEREYLYET
jgi:prefoldin subunit 5